jgi:hypothetical protein
MRPRGLWIVVAAFGAVSDAAELAEARLFARG